MNLHKGSKVWVPDKELAWVAAEVLDSNGNRVQLVTNSGKVSFSVDSACCVLVLIICGNC